MKTAEALLAGCVVDLACFTGGQRLGVSAATTQSEAVVRDAFDSWSRDATYWLDTSDIQFAIWYPGAGNNA